MLVLPFAAGLWEFLRRAGGLDAVGHVSPLALVCIDLALTMGLFVQPTRGASPVK